MRLLLRRYAVVLTVILALTFLLVGSSFAAIRAHQTLTGETAAIVRLGTAE